MHALLLLLAFQITPELEQSIASGMKAKSAGDLEGAIKSFRRVTELAPTMAAGHVNLGAIYLAKRDYAAAVPAFRKALALNPDQPGTHGMLGTSLLAQGFGCEAVPHLEKGRSGDLLGVALLECGKPREALEQLEAAIERRPDDPDLLYYLGQTHTELAKRSFETLQTAHPDAPRTHQMLGEAQASTNNRAAAEKHFRSALQARPELREVHHALGELLFKAGDYAKAELEFREEARLSPGSAATAYMLGLTLAHLGRNAEALVELKRADALRPGMPETQLELGKLLLASGDAAAAEVHLRAVLEVERSSGIAETAHFQIAQAYRKLGRTADAARHLKAFQDLRSKVKQ